MFSDFYLGIASSIIISILSLVAVVGTLNDLSQDDACGIIVGVTFPGIVDDRITISDAAEQNIRATGAGGSLNVMGDDGILGVLTRIDVLGEGRKTFLRKNEEHTIY